MLRLLLFLSACVAFSVARAETPLPDIDINAQCEEQIAKSRAGLPGLYSCMLKEQSARDRLRARWPMTPEPVRQRCTIDRQDYLQIADCIDRMADGPRKDRRTIVRQRTGSPKLRRRTTCLQQTM